MSGEIDVGDLHSERSGTREFRDRIDTLEESIRALTLGLYRVSKVAVEAPIAWAAWSFGMAIAVVLSWSRSTSILWCLLHGFLSWVYVIYFALTR